MSLNVKAVNATAQDFAKALKKFAKKGNTNAIEKIQANCPSAIKENGKISTKRLTDALIKLESDMFTNSGKLTEAGKQEVIEGLSDVGLKKSATIKQLLKAIYKKGTKMQESFENLKKINLDKELEAFKIGMRKTLKHTGV